MKNAPYPVISTIIDSPVNGIETKITVYNMAYGNPQVADFIAQVYRRRGGVGEFKIVHTTENCGNVHTAMLRARAWHRAFPRAMMPANTSGPLSV